MGFAAGEGIDADTSRRGAACERGVTGTGEGGSHDGEGGGMRTGLAPPDGKRGRVGEGCSIPSDVSTSRGRNNDATQRGGTPTTRDVNMHSTHCVLGCELLHHSSQRETLTRAVFWFLFVAPTKPNTVHAVCNGRFTAHARYVLAGQKWVAVGILCLRLVLHIPPVLVTHFVGSERGCGPVGSRGQGEVASYIQH